MMKNQKGKRETLWEFAGIYDDESGWKFHHLKGMKQEEC
jgi:hypothetical protein